MDIFNIQTFLILIFIFYLISNNYFNLTIINKSFTSSYLLLKIFVGTSFIYYYSIKLNFKLNTELFIYYNNALKIYSTLDERFIPTLKIIFGEEKTYKSVLDQITFWNRDFDYGIPNDNKTMIRIHLTLCLLLGKSILNHFLIFILISFLCTLTLIKTLRKNGIKTIGLIIVLLIPSLLFWTSSTYKENLIISIHCILISTLVNYRNTKKTSYMAIAIFILFSSIIIKPIYLIITIPFLISFILYQHLPTRRWMNRLTMIIILLITIITSLSSNTINIEKDEFKYGNKFNPLKMIQLKQEDFFYEAFHGKAKTLLKLELLNPNIISSISTFKDAFFNAFFEPSFSSILKFQSYPFIIENLLLFYLFMRLWKTKTIWRFDTTDKFLFLTGLTICLSSGLITPVLGTLLKFKSLGYVYLFVFLVKKNFQVNQ